MSLWCSFFFYDRPVQQPPAISEQGISISFWYQNESFSLRQTLLNLSPKEICGSTAEDLKHHRDEFFIVYVAVTIDVSFVHQFLPKFSLWVLWKQTDLHSSKRHERVGPPGSFCCNNHTWHSSEESFSPSFCKTCIGERLIVYSGFKIP